MTTAPEPAELTRAVRALQLASHGAEQALARRLDLGGNDVAALQVIFGSEAAMGPVELGHRLGIRSASATALVDRLETVGHLRRVAHPQDGRRVVLETTESAVSDTLSALTPLLRSMDAVAADLDGDDRAVVLRFLERTTVALEAYASTSTRTV